MTNKEKLELTEKLINEIGADIEDRKEVFNISAQSAEGTKSALAKLSEELDSVAKELNVADSDLAKRFKALLKAKIEFCERCVIAHKAKQEMSSEIVGYLASRRKIAREFYSKKIKK